MPIARSHNSERGRAKAGFALRSWVRRCVWIAAGIAAGAALAGAGPPQQPAQTSPSTPAATRQQPAPANGDLPAVHQEKGVSGAEAKQPGSEVVQANPNRKITEESAELLKLARDLKSEVDKTTKDTLSMGVIRKAEQIRRLAQSVRAKGKPETAWK